MGCFAVAVAAAGQRAVLHLHGAVVDVEFRFQAFGEGGQPGGIGPAGAHEVGHEGGIVAGTAQAPDVEVVHGFDGGLGQQVGAHGFGVDAIGHGLQAQAQAVA